MSSRGDAGPAGSGAGGCAGAGGEEQPGQPDAVLLAPLTEDTFLHNLHVRYMQDVIYTYVGQELVSVNPCRALPLYSAELVRTYLARPPHTLPPHLYALCAAALRWAQDRHDYQCIVMTGESGAGKTEAARVCLQCAVLAGDAGGGGGAGGAGGALTAAGTLLEAFGHAATMRNHNASRFGKLLDVEFDFRGEPVGGHITHFLLEKSRASGAGVGAGERNFHVLYQLLAGADVTLLKRLKLHRSWESYRVLCGRGGGGAGGCRSPRRTPPPHDPTEAVDAQHFAFTKAAMCTLGFDRAARAGVLRVLAFLLKLGNVRFEPHHNIDGSLGAQAHPQHELEEACALVGVCARSLAAALGAAPPAPAAPAHLLDHLTHNDSSTTEEESDSDSGSAAGSEGSGAEWGRGDGGSGGGRDAAGWARARTDRLIQHVYGRLFTWLVGSVNSALRLCAGAARDNNTHTLGILDVYGLESLSHNGLERLLINYAAERVQTAVWRAAARQAEEAAREGLPPPPTPLPLPGAPPAATELLEAGPESLLALVERAGREPLVARLQRRHHPRLHVLPPHHFQVVHFGGAVVYSARGMASKNRDAVCCRAAAALSQAADPLLAALFPPAHHPPHHHPPYHPAGAGGGSPRHSAGGLAARQRALLAALARKLHAAGGMRVVRCLRPEPALRPHRFDPHLVRHQLHTQGIVEMAMWRRAGWCESMCARALLQRYGVLLGCSGGGSKGPLGAVAAGSPHGAVAAGSPHGAVAAARALLRSLPIPAAEFAFGRTKVFIRSPRTVWELEALRGARVGALVGAAQRAWRRHRARQLRAAAVCKRHQAQAVIARAYRAYRKTRALPERLALRRRLQARRRITSLGGAGVEATRAWAGGVIWRAWCTWARRRWLQTLGARLPPRHWSPLCAAWPPCPWPALLGAAEGALRRLHHRWRCARYRAAFDQTARNRMREKVTASVLFRERKATYAASVAHPFVGDYVRLRASAQWRRGPGAGADRYVVFADVCRKARSREGGGGTRVLVAVSTHALLLLDARSLRVRRRVPATTVYRLSLSPYHDDLLAVHVRPSGGLESSTEELSQCSSRGAPDPAGCLLGEGSGKRRSGDVLLRAVHVLELATKLFLVVQNACGHPPLVHIAPMFECSLGGSAVTVCVHPPSGAGAGAGEGGPRLVRRGSRLDVLL